MKGPGLRCLCIVVVMACGMGLSVRAQHNDVPLERSIYLDLEKNAACRGSRIHTGLKPVIQSRVDLAGVTGYSKDTTKSYYWLTEILFRRHLMQVRTPDFRLNADIMLDLQLGQDFRDQTQYSDTTRFYQNTRGVWVSGDIGPRLSFQTAFFENQVLYPQYLYLRTKDRGIVPGQGRVKPFNGRAYDFGWAQGNVSWSPRGWMNVQLGQGRHFVGHGYRSMLLSDSNAPYPYLKLSWSGWQKRLQYSNIYARLQMLQRLPAGESSESLFYWKRATFNHLSLTLGRVDIALFEASIFRTLDSAGTKPLNALTYNPVIGINTLVNGFEGEHTQVVGIDLRVKLTDKLFIYGQGVTSSPAEGRFGWQAGMRWFNLFGRDIHLQLEYNAAQPFLYTQHRPVMNYAHDQESLAHPFGAYFNEAIAILDYRILRKVLLKAKVNLGTYNLDIDSVNSNYGGNILMSDVVGVQSLQGPLVRDLAYVDLSVAYLLNPMSNMQFVVGYWVRDLSPAPDQLTSGYLYAAFRMSIFNRYYDF